MAIIAACVTRVVSLNGNIRAVAYNAKKADASRPGLSRRAVKPAARFTIDLRSSGSYTRWMPYERITCPHECSAVIFDLDGTLTRPHLDFDAIRYEIGLPSEPRVPILESLDHMSPEQRQRAWAILDRHEQEAARASALQEGAIEVLDTLRARGLPIGLSTRNSRACTEIVLQQHGLRFDRVHTRDDGVPKPSPEPILRMCREWNVSPAASWVVGDYLFDLQAGRAAGSKTVLMLGQSPLPTYANLADHVIRNLRELTRIIGFSFK